MLISLIIAAFINVLYVKCNYNESKFPAVYCYLACSKEENQILKKINLNVCIESCENDHQFQDVSEDVLFTKKDLYAPKLQCRSEHELTFYWNSTESTFYILEIQEKSSDWIPTTTTQENMHTFQNLLSNTEYRTRIWGLADVDVEQFWGPIETDWYRTLENDTSDLDTPNLTISNIQVTNQMLEITINWLPTSDERVCFYDLLWYSEKGDPLDQREIQEPKDFYEETVNFQYFDTTYHIGIKTMTGSLNQESIISWKRSFAPSCYELYKNISICPPPTPEDVNITEKLVQKLGIHTSLFDLAIDWKEPEVHPENYILKLTRTHLNETGLEIEAAGNETTAEFKNVTLGYQYFVTIFANSSGGMSKPGFYRRFLKDIEDSKSLVQIGTVIGISISTIATIIILFIVIYTYYKRTKHKNEESSVYFQDLREGDKNRSSMEDTPERFELEKDCWEIQPHRLVLQSLLGEGAFGLVRKGWLKELRGNTLIPVAVKMLKDSPSPEQTKHFLREINIMKSVGSHPNLVSIIGCCVSDKPPYSLMLVVEYCALGDLQNYLRTAWNHMMSTSNQYTNTVSEQLSKNIVVNQLYEFESGGSEIILQSCDLLSFARQIAKGMEFLSSLKVLHRDLAARNVLVSEDKCVKVADFGLSRDVYRDNIYQKSGNSKLPIKWIAIESLTHQIYTTQSDVWSFGILLWEIVTLGGNPYPSIPTNKLLQKLLSGYRMEKPSNCGIDLYNLMCSCWKARPKERPTFTELRHALDKLLESSTAVTYLKLDVFSTSDLATFYNLIED